MKRALTFLFFTLLSMSLWAVNYDFEENGIYYKIIGSNVLTGYTVEVTYGGDFTYSGTPSYTGEITIPSSTTFERTPCQVVSIGESAFYMSNVTKITIPESVTTIGEKAFYRSTSLEEVNFSEGLTTLGDQAFYLCSALTEVTLPSTVTTISFKCFGSCSALQTIVSRPTTPPTVPTASDENPFDGVASDCVLYVPAKALEAYSSAEVWSDFTTILPITTVGERIMGYYDTDALPESIWETGTYLGWYYYNGDDYYASNLFMEDVTENFLRSNITKIRFALANDEVKIYSAFVCEFDADYLSQTTDDGRPIPNIAGMDPISRVDLTTGFTPQQGWNTVELDTPVEVKADKWYMVGFEYEQTHDRELKSSFPLVTDKELETDYTSYWGLWIYAPMMSDYGLDWYYWRSEGQLCIQAVCESEEFGDDDIGLKNLVLPKYVTSDDDITFTYRIRSYGNYIPNTYTLGVDIDGQQVATFTDPVKLTDEYQTVSVSLEIPTFLDTSVAEHSLRVYVISINGDTPEYGTTDDQVEGTFLYYAETYERQMHLIENYTSINCGYCPLGHELLELLQEEHPDKYAWVCMHGSLMGDDPYILYDESYLEYFFGVSSIGYPTGTFSRILLNDESLNSYGTIAIGIGWDEYQHQTAATLIDNAIDEAYEAIPAFVPVNINAQYDRDTREVSITVSGDGASIAREVLAEDVLTVYLTEDNVVGVQEDYSNGSADDGYFIDYVHNNVLRAFVSPYYGSAIQWTSGSSYSNSYTVTLSDDWKASNMKVVAFISGPLVDSSGSWAPTAEAYVSNCNELRLSETSGISSAVSDPDAHEVARYTVDGRRVNSPTKGVNLVRMSDGMVKKVIVK